MKTEKKLFDLIHKIGEGTYKKIHIIDQSDEYPNFEDDVKYRVYHSDGYCFDIERERIIDKDENYNDIDEENIDGMIYNFFSGYEGFQEVELEYLITKISNNSDLL